MSSAACWSASTARAGEAVRPAVPKLETFLEDTWNQEHARIAKDRQRLRTGSCWAGRDPRASRGPQAFAPKRATISCNMTHWSSRSVRAAQESHRLRSGNRRLREDKSPTGLACVSGALLLNAFARSPSGGPPLLVVRAGLGTVMDLAPRRGAADRRRIQRQYQAFRVLCCAVPQRDPPAPWPATLIAPPENTAQDCRESARLRDRRRARRARVSRTTRSRWPRGACRRSANQQPGPLTRGSRPISGRDLWCVFGVAWRDWLVPIAT